MDFQLSKTHKLLQQMLRQFAEKELKPIAKELDEQERYPYETIEKFYDNGFMSFHLPEELGGSSGDSLGYAITMEEFARIDTPTAGILSGHNEATVRTIHEWGTKEQKEKYLPQLTGKTARRMGGFSLTEPTAGSDSNGVQTRAVLEGDHYVVNGTKCFVTNGGVAELFILVAVTDPNVRGGKGKSAFILDKNFPGVTVGKKEKMMGFGAASICELILNNVKIPKENILGKEGDGLKVALGGLEGGRIIVAAEGIGNAQGLLDETKKFINSTKLDGKLLAQYQHVQFKFAEMQTQVDVARLMVHKAATMLDAGIPCNLEASQAKYFATKTANDIAKDCVQLFGQFGYTNKYNVERFMRDAKLTEIYEGTNEIQKMVISRGMGLKVRG
jgi:butyryl-CoA dehydrogenase